MARSMTGFGRGVSSDEGGQATVEIKSVNNRYCDIQVRAPRFLSVLEPELRSRCKAFISRGKLDLMISFSDVVAGSRKVSCDLALAASYRLALQEIGATLNVPDTTDACTLASFPDVLSVEDASPDTERIAGLIFAALADALEHLLEMKSEEGVRLTADITAGCNELENLLVKVKSRAAVVPQEYRERLRQRWHDLLDEDQLQYIDEQRLAAEVLLFADKADVHEEIVRLESHLTLMKQVVAQDEPVGKQLDFFCQEVNREINTIGSKANDLELTNLIISMKSELEKIREQVQNLE